MTSLLLVFTLVACHRDKPVDNLPVPVVETPTPKQTQEQAVATIKANFERVSFAYDSAALDAASKAALADNAKILQEHPDVAVQVQGHCDERGTTEYNLALGQKRADAVYKFLVSSGVPAARLQVVSYGEERPLASGDGETVWAQNRRAEFKVTTPTDAVVGTTM